VPKAVIIVGLPASGKSTYALKLVAIKHGYLLIDDSAMGYSDFYLKMATDYLKDNHNCIFTDISLCSDVDRERCAKVLSLYATVEWIFFANNPAQCLMNARKRGDLISVKDDIQRLSKLYNTPHGSTVFSVYGTPIPSEVFFEASTIVNQRTRWDRLWDFFKGRKW
jgi:hypothetical protein